MRVLFTILSICLLTMAQAAPTYVSFEKAYLGVYTNQISKQKAKMLGFDNPYGSYVTRVIKNTAAEKAGMQAFDYIVAINETELSRTESLGKVLKDFESDEYVTIHFYRKGEKKSLQVKLGSRDDRNFEFDEDQPDPFLGITPHEENNNKKPGVLVNVINYSAAAEMGLQDGDLITAINDTPMIDWKDIEIAINNMKVGEQIEVAFDRAGQSMTKSTNMRSYEETQEIRKNKKYEKAFMGINFAQLSKEKARKLGFDNPYGSYVTAVIPNTAAEKAGIQPFDYLFGVDEYRVGESQSLGAILSKYSAGDMAKISLIRKGEIKKLDITFGRKSDAGNKMSKSKCEDPFLGVQKSHKAPAENGIRVNIVSESTAEDIGMQNGDVIQKINGFAMVDWDDISIAIDMLDVGETITVGYQRNGKPMQGSKPIKSYCETKGDEDRSFTFDFDQDFDFDFNFDDDENELRSAEMRNIEDMKVELTNISQTEASEMKEQHGVDMPIVNNLKIEALKLFPNPSRGLFQLSFELPKEADTVIRIYNAQGRKIYEYELGSFSGEFKDEVDISQNGAGAYFLEIRQGNQSISRKILLKQS